MNRLGIILIFGALLISALLSGLIFKMHKKVQGPVVTEVLVAVRALNRGQRITDADVKWQIWKPKDLGPGYIVQGQQQINDVIGALVREPVAAGIPLTNSMLIPKSSLSPLANVVNPGMRAYTINVTLSSALGGLVTPGDSVDVILTYSRQTPGSMNKEYESKTILRNVTVLGVDENLSSETMKTTTKQMGSPVYNTRNVTLQVMPAQADLLATGEQMGTLSLSLTSPIESSEAKPKLPVKDEPAPGIILIHGEKVEQMGKSGS